MSLVRVFDPQAQQLLDQARSGSHPDARLALAEHLRTLDAADEHAELIGNQCPAVRNQRRLAHTKATSTIAAGLASASTRSTEYAARPKLATRRFDEKSSTVSQRAISALRYTELWPAPLAQPELFELDGQSV